MFGGMGGSLTDLLSMMGLGGQPPPPVTPQSQGQGLGMNSAFEDAMMRGGGMPQTPGFVGNQTANLRGAGPVGQGPQSQAPMDMYKNDVTQTQGGMSANNPLVGPEGIKFGQKAITDLSQAIAQAPGSKAPPAPRQQQPPQKQPIANLAQLLGGKNMVDPMAFLQNFQQANAAGGGGPAQLQALLAQMLGRR